MRHVIERRSTGRHRTATCHNFSMRVLWHGLFPVIALAAVIALMKAALASDSDTVWFPTKNIEIIVPASPGGGFDRAARTIQRIWQDKQIIVTPINVLNKPGGGGAISWAYLKERKEDGNVLCISTPNILTNHITGKSSLTYTDFTPIAQLYNEYPVFAVRADSPLKTGQDLVRRLKEAPNSLAVSVGSGYGNANHLAMVLIAKSAGLATKKLRVVVFKGSSEAMVALLGRHIDVAIVGASVSLPHLEFGQIRILGISAPQRLSGMLVSVPTWKEQGINSVMGNWRGIIGAPHMRPAQVSYWDNALNQLTNAPEWKEAADDSLWILEYMDSKKSWSHLESEYSRLRALLEELGLAR